MMIHKNAVHVMERNEDGSALQCDVCQKEFKNYTLMNQHRRRIHFAKQHPCKKCDFSASSKYQLKKHYVTKHPAEDAQEFTCHLCDKKFAHLHFLKNHFLSRHSTAKK
jgi:Zinc finger, C2H2 type